MEANKSLFQNSLSLWERVGVRVSHRRSQSRKLAAIRATLIPSPCPVERARRGCGIGSKRGTDRLFLWRREMCERRWAKNLHGGEISSS